MNHRTELEIANEKLREAENKLSLFASNARDLLYRYRLHPERGFDYVSPSALTLTGFTPEEHYSDPDLGYKLVHPDDRVKLEKLTEGNEVFSNPIQLRWVKKDGSIVWTEQVNVPVVDDKGTLLAIEGIARDITERKLAELSLLESEKRYRELFENMSSGFVLFEVVQNEQGIPVDLIIKAANVGFEKTTGVTLEDAIGQRLTELLPGIEKEEADWIGTYSKVALTGEATQFEQGSELLGYYYSISAFRAATNQCAVTFVDITERKKAEELLQVKSEEIEVQNEEYKQLNEELLKTQKEFEISSKNFENIFTNSPIGIFVIDIDIEKNYIINSSNPVHEKLLGIKNEKVKGQPLVILAELFSYEVYVYVKNFYDEIVKTKKTKNFEENLIINNIPVQVNTTIKPLIDENGKVYRLIGTNIDITELKQTEKELIAAKEKAEESEERFELAMKASNDGLFDWNLETNEIYYSPAWKKMLGYEDDELPNDFSVWENTTDPWDVKKSWELQQKLINKEVDRFVLEFKMKHKDGHWVDILSRAEAIFNDSGKAVRIVGTHTDITEHKLAEETRRESDERFRIAQDMSPDGFTILRPVRDDQNRVVDFTWIYENDSIARLNGTDPQKVVGQRMLELFPGHRDTQFMKVYKQVAESGKSITFEEGYSGESMQKQTWFRIVVVPMAENIAILAQDITERKHLLEELEKLNTELELKVEQRTALLEASNKELEAFSYSVSHDLRAPLRHINGYVDLLTRHYRDELPDKARHYLETVSGASRQMGTLIDELLQYSRTGRQEVRKTELEMNLLVKEALQNLKSDTEGKKITWDIQELPKVFGDYTLLKQVWINLFDNAVKYTRNQKNAKITVGFSEEAKEFVFCVCDNGVGFDMKYAHKLFGVFQRLHSQSEFEGTGIGLANVQRIINKHMGRVWAEGETGKGANFYFTIPKYLEELQ